MMNRRAGIFLAPGRRPWEHEMRVAEILALAGHCVEFLKEGLLPEADIMLDGVKYEIKSPEAFNTNTLEHTIKDALKQSPNIIIDMFRMKRADNLRVRSFLVRQVCSRKQIKRMLLITKQGEIIDIFKLI